MPDMWKAGRVDNENEGGAAAVVVQLVLTIQSPFLSPG